MFIILGLVILVAAVAVFGLSLLLSAARRTSRRGSVARHGLQQSRDETAAVTEDRGELIDQRDALIDQRETAREKSASASRNGSPNGNGNGNGNVDPDTDRRSLLHPLGHRAVPPEATTTTADR